MRLCAFLLVATSLATPQHAEANGERISWSHSNAGMMFMAFISADESSDRHVGFESDGRLRALYEHCDSSLPVFDLLTGESYKCKLTIRRTHKGEENWSSAGISIHGSNNSAEYPDFGVFDTSPPSKIDWQVAPLTAKERADIQATSEDLAGPKLNFHMLESAWTVRAPGGSVATFFVPGERVGEPDSDYYAQRHHVFISVKGAVLYEGRIPDKPTDYIDSNRDGIPEVITAEQCDGLCVTLWRLDSGPKGLITFGGH